MTSALNIFFLVFAAIFPVVNPPGSALVFLGLTRDAAHEIRRILAWRVARNSFFVLVCSFFLGALVLKFYGISIPVLRTLFSVVLFKIHFLKNLRLVMSCPRLIALFRYALMVFTYPASAPSKSCLHVATVVSSDTDLFL